MTRESLSMDICDRQPSSSEPDARACRANSMRQFDIREDENNLFVYETSKEFVEFAKRYSGMSWTSRDVPASGLR